MIKYILIIVLSNGGMHSIEFDNRLACKAAKKDMAGFEAAFNNPQLASRVDMAYCVPKYKAVK